MRRLARLMRCAMVASGTRKALAISAVVSPPTARSVRAIDDVGVSAGWQQWCEGGARGPVQPPAPPPSLIRADHEGVVIETVKWSEDGRGLIVRLQESMRQRGDVTLSTAFQE